MTVTVFKGRADKQFLCYDNGTAVAEKMVVGCTSSGITQESIQASGNSKKKRHIYNTYKKLEKTAISFISRKSKWKLEINEIAAVFSAFLCVINVSVFQARYVSQTDKIDTKWKHIEIGFFSNTVICYVHVTLFIGQ